MQVRAALSSALILLFCALGGTEGFAVGGNQGRMASAQLQWEKRYKGFIKEEGFRSCGAAWQGYCQLGRGAMYINEDTAAETQVNSIFIPRGKLTSSISASDMETMDMKQIVNRIDDYDPDSEFVVIFQSDGLCGVDVVKPNMAPQQVAKALREQQRP